MTTTKLNRLVLRRTTAEKGNKIAVRLSPDFDRTDDPFEVFSEGIIIEVLDVEDAREKGESVVTVGVHASDSFKIDRVEVIRLPRPLAEVGREESVRVQFLKEEKLREMALEDIEEHEHLLLDAENKLSAQKTRLTLDRSRAVERGWQRANNDNYDRWQLLSEEIIIVTEQLTNVRNQKTRAQAARKAALVKINEAVRSGFQDKFVQICREQLDSKTYEKIKGEARRLAEG